MHQRHRIIESFRLEGILKIILFQSHCDGQGHLIAQSPIHPGLKHFQEWDIYNFSGQLVLAPQHTHSEGYTFKHCTILYMYIVQNSALIWVWIQIGLCPKVCRSKCIKLIEALRY